MTGIFTPEQISQILEEFFKVVGTRQYIGARYVPIFGRKGETSIQWDNSAPYEPLTIVLYQGNSYTSRQYVPADVEITNQEFWALTGNYNAQIESYREVVERFDQRITANETAIETHTNQLAGTEPSGLQTTIAANKAELQEAMAEDKNELQTGIDTNADDISALDMRIDALEASSHDVLLFGDSWTDANFDSPKWMSEAFKDIHYSNVYNYAVSGAGWVQGTNVEVQIATANNALTTEQKKRIDTIIVFALVNDLKALTTYSAFDTQAGNILSAMNRSFALLSTQYPNARIYFMPTVAGDTYTNGLAFTLMAMFNKRVESGSAESWNLPYVSDFFNVYLQWNDSVIYQSTGLHLTNSGAKAIGAAINKVLKGIPVPAEMQLDQNISSNDGTLVCNLYYNHTARLVGKFTPSAAMNQWATSSFAIPRGTAFNKMLISTWCQRNAIALPNGLITTMQAGSGTIYGSMLLSGNSGSNTLAIGIQHENGINANSNIYGVL